MADKRTPGLLAVNPLRPNQICTADGSLEIAVATMHSVATSVSNARRIVACWNACQGISTKNLEENKPVIWLAQQYSGVIKQRDDLLDVAQAILAEDMLQYLPAEFVAKVRAAIAKATGEQS
jgi:hypothetical protein